MIHKRANRDAAMKVTPTRSTISVSKKSPRREATVDFSLRTPRQANPDSILPLLPDSSDFSSGSPFVLVNPGRNPNFSSKSFANFRPRLSPFLLDKTCGSPPRLDEDLSNDLARRLTTNDHLIQYRQDSSTSAPLTPFRLRMRPSKLRHDHDLYASPQAYQANEPQTLELGDLPPRTLRKLMLPLL